MVLQSLAFIAPQRHGGLVQSKWLARLQRLYQIALILLLLSVFAHVLHHVTQSSSSWLGPVVLSTWVTQPDDETEVSVTITGTDQFAVTLRGTFTWVWEPRDTFEFWMLALLLRRLHRPGARKPFLTQRQVATALACQQAEVSYWERAVREHSWHILSDRYRHQLQSVLPKPELSRAILKTWVPRFWLSAWDVRERLIAQGVIAHRDTLEVDALHTLAKHTGFNLVRDMLLERFDAQAGQLIAREHWWLKELVALNERLIAKLERGERLTPQELVDIEPLRLQTPENQALFAILPPVVAHLTATLFPSPTAETSAPIRCTYCGSDHVRPKSKKPRLKTVVDEFGEEHQVAVLRYYCKNPDCPYQTFTHLPPGLVPHSRYPVRVRLLAVEVYEQLLSTYRRSARMFEVKASTLYRWVASVCPAALMLAAYLGAVRTSGVVGIDDKWILVCSPSAVRPHGRRPRAVWRYAYFAVDVYSYDLLALELYPEHCDEAVRLFLLELKAKGIRPRVVVSDLDPAYGRILPQVFPNAVHHECIFHAIQNALRQMTKVYGRHFQEKVPETVPLYEAITHLFQAQTQKTVRKRFVDFLELRSSYVTRTPDIACVFDSLENHFPKLVNAIESPLIPRTNNCCELVIRRFDQHYQGMCGLDSFESARLHLRIFELVYRLTPFADDNPSDLRGKCPLELAGYDLQTLPIANFFTNLKLLTDLSRPVVRTEK
jgi:transposase-like protein